MIKGTYFSGESSQAHVAELYVSADGSVHLSGVQVPPCAVTALEISPRVGNAARLISLPNGGRFQTSHNDAVDNLVQQWLATGHWFQAYNWETKLKYIGLSVMLTVALVGTAIIWGIPFAAKRVAFALPPEISRNLAEGALAQMDDVYFKPSELDSARQRTLKHLFRQHLPTNTAFRYTLLFRKSPSIGPNAFALPDGTVVLTDELVALTDNNDQLLSVLLHEIGHVEQRHAMRGTLQATGLYAIYSWITGDLTATSSIVAMVPVILTQAGYSRRLEWEADSYALSAMQAQAIDPMHFADMMTKLEQFHTEQEQSKDEAENGKNPPAGEAERDAGLLSYLATHPPSAQRIERFRQASQASHSQAN